MIYVMSDIHGRKDRFDDVLKQIQLTAQDTLYILGDVIDRNSDGIAILKYIMGKPNIKMLLGNHEYMMLNALKSKSEMSIWYRNGGNVTHNRWKKQRISTREQILNYIESLPIMHEFELNSKRYRLVHGKSPSKKRLAYLSMVELKDEILWDRVNAKDTGFDDVTVVFGHTPTIYYQDDMPLRIWHKEYLIGIDCGAAYLYGRLACLRLDDMKEFYSNC